MKMKCCICGKGLQAPTHAPSLPPKMWGHNALPVKDGRCCDSCNLTVVIPERIARIAR